MKKSSLVLALLLSGLAIGGLSSCDNNNVSENLITNFTVQDVGDVCYGDEIDFSKLVSVETDSDVAVFKVKLTSLTPSTISVDSEKSSVAIVIGVGECQVKVTIGTLEKVVTFNSYASVSSISCKRPTETLKVGDSLNLDEYVAIKVASPKGSQGAYFATSKNEDVALIAQDGKTVNLVGPGDLNIEIRDVTGKRKAYLTGTVFSQMQLDVKEFASKIKHNYSVYSFSRNSNGFAKYFPTIHTDSYAAYPYYYYFGGTKYEDEPYQGYLAFSDYDVYSFGCNVYRTSTDQNYTLPDVSTINLGAKEQYEKSQYYSFADYDYSYLDKCTVHYDLNGEEDYVEMPFTANNYSLALGDSMGISLPNNAYSKIGITVGKAFDDDKENSLLVYMLDENDNIVNGGAISEVGTTDYAPLTNFVSDKNNIPNPIDSTSMKERLMNIINSNNYTVTSRTFIADDTGKELSFAEAVNLYAPLHTLYYSGTGKYTSESMLVSNVESFQGFEGQSDRLKVYAYKNKDNKTYEVNYDESKKVYSLGDYVEGSTSYKDVFNGLYNFNFDDFDEFVFLGYEEPTYSFTIGKNSKKGSENLRKLVNFANPDMTESLFPTNTNDNNFEAGFAGSGTFTLKSDGGYTFTYYSSRLGTTTAGTYISFRMCIELTVSNVNSTVIDEFNNL